MRGENSDNPGSADISDLVDDPTEQIALPPTHTVEEVAKLIDRDHNLTERQKAALGDLFAVAYAKLLEFE